MISATRRWLRRNRNGIAIAAGVVGATYLAGQYVMGKISEARERMNLDRIAKENLRRRFEQNQTDCTFTVLALLPTMTENILEALPVEQLTQELQRKKAERLARAAGENAPSEMSSAAPSLRDGDTASLSSFQSSSFIHASQIGEDSVLKPRKSKAELWNEIKISSITRSFTLLYTLSLLTLLTRIQLNLLGRLNYISSVVTLAQPPPPDRANSISLEDNEDPSLHANSSNNTSANLGNDFETNRRYLTFSWFLLHRGYYVLLNKIRDAVTEVFGSISPTETLTAAHLSELTLSVRKKIEGSTEQERQATRWLPYLLPPVEEEQSVLIESGVISPPNTSSVTSAEPTGPRSGSPSSTIDSSFGPLRQLLDETADLIDSPSFTHVHTLLLNSFFSYLIDTKVAQQAFPAPPLSLSPTSSLSPAPPVQPPERNESAATIIPAEGQQQAGSKLATILAVMTRQAHAIGNGNNPPNEYISVAEEEVKELEAFAAVIYASNLDVGLDNFRNRAAEQGMGGAGGPGLLGPSSEGQPPADPDDMFESRLENAWSKIMTATGFQ